MSTEITPCDIVKKLTQFIQHNIPVTFSKYGDGEYYCATATIGNNCDYDNYTPKLKNALISSFKYMIDENKSENTFIGMWHDPQKCEFWKNLVENKDKIQWAEYHTFIVDIKDFENMHINNDLNDKIALYKAIQYSKLKKYVICNSLMLKTRLLFKADDLLLVPFQNWFDDHFNNVLALLVKRIGDDLQPMVILACGMSAKVMISELHKLYPNGIFIDVGSAMDLLCTKRDSRGRMYNYQTIYNKFQHLLPDDWEDEKWGYLYNEANNKMGLHM